MQILQWSHLPDGSNNWTTIFFVSIRLWSWYEPYKKIVFTTHIADTDIMSVLINSFPNSVNWLRLTWPLQIDASVSKRLGLFLVWILAVPPILAMPRIRSCISMVQWKKDVTPLLTHLFARTHRYDRGLQAYLAPCHDEQQYRRRKLALSTADKHWKLWPSSNGLMHIANHYAKFQQN